MLGAAKYLLLSHSASVEKEQQPEGWGEVLHYQCQMCAVVLPQCLKQEHSIDYHDYFKKEKERRGQGQGKGRAWLLAVPSLCALPQALHWRHNDTVRLRQELGTVLLLHFGEGSEFASTAFLPAWPRVQRWSWPSSVGLAWASQVRLTSGFFLILLVTR